MTSKGSHHAYDAHYHIVFPVKYRKALLREDITTYIKEIAQNIEERYDITFDQIGCDQNHIHLLTSFPPTMHGGEVVRIFKSITARELFKQFPDIKKDLWGGNFWSAGYYFATVGKRGDWNIVKNYVKKQGVEGNMLGQPHTQLRLL